MRLGIDASNIRGGGGYTILEELLKQFNPDDFGVESIKIWANSDITEKLQRVNPSLNVMNAAALDKGFFRRFSWRTFSFPKIARDNVDLLLIPGGMPIVKGVKNVSMSLNLLPFVPHEYKREGTTIQHLKYVILKHTNYRSLSKSHGAIFLNENARHVIYKGRNGDQPYAVCPLGVDTRFFKNDRAILNNDHYSHHRPFKFIYVSTVNAYKHQWVVARAVKRARDDGYPVIVEFIGGSYPSSLERLHNTIESLGGEKSGTKYLGKVPFEDLHEYYHNADGFIFASSCENMPNIGIEAMAAALPMAASNLEPMKTLFADCAVFFDPEDELEIERAVKQIFDNLGLRENISQAAFANAKQYSWHKFYKESFTFFNEIYSRA